MFIPKPSTVSVRSLDDTVHLYHISDIHLKERGCNESLLRKHIQIIKDDPNAIVVLGGDQTSYITKNDKRFDFDGVAEGVDIYDLGDWSNYLVDSLVDIISPIADKVIVALEGNHETKYKKTNQHDVHKMFCDRLGLYNGGYTSVFCIRFKDMNESNDLIVHATHGKGGSVTSGGVVNKLKKYSMHVANSDLVLVGHMHHQISVVEKVMYYKEGIRNHYKLCVCPGSYLESYGEGYTSYGEEAGYAPPIVGCARIDIVPRTKEMQVVWMK